jgi:hypothetical protein
MEEYSLSRDRRTLDRKNAQARARQARSWLGVDDFAFKKATRPPPPRPRSLSIVLLFFASHLTPFAATILAAADLA